MYLEHYGLREAPFRITPHTDFFFAGGNRGATLEALTYAITQDEGIVKVTGEVGSGKTMLCRMLLEKLPETVETVYLANPSYSRDEILYALAAELQLPLPEGRAPLLLKALQERLLQSYAEGRRIVVLIDEAHAMPGETLEEIRLLSNLESSRHKLLQIVLFGQPELDARLIQADLRQLKERITHNFALEPLRRNDVGPYLMFRLRAAGYHGPNIFSAKAVQAIAQASEGLTRRINILADKSLLAAFADSTHLVDEPQVKAAVRDAQFTPIATAPNLARKPTAAMAGLGLAVALALTTGAYWAGRQSAAAPAQQAPQQAAQQTPPSALPAPSSEGAPRTEQAAADTTPAAVTKSNGKAAPLLTEERLNATQTWLQQTDGRRFVIQLLAVDGPAAPQVQSFLTQASKEVDTQLLRPYQTHIGSKERWGVVYGEYAGYGEAQQAIAALPERLRRSHPYPRPVSQLR